MRFTKIKIPLELDAVDQEGFHLYLTAWLEGIPCRMVLDTGASQTIFDRSFITNHWPDKPLQAKEGVSVGAGDGTIQSHLVACETFQIGHMQWHDNLWAVIDLSHVNSYYQAMEKKPIQGILGNDVLVGKQALIDYRKLLLYLHAPAENRI